MRKLYVLAGAAMVAAIILSAVWKPMTFEERLVRIQAEEAPPEFASALADEPLEVRAVALEYANDPLLQLKLRAALIAYPELTRKILPLYGEEPEFQEILRKHGQSIFPPIEYFLSNDVRSLYLVRYVAETMESAEQAAARLRLWGSDEGPATHATDIAIDTEAPTKIPQESARERSIAPEERGWYAVNFIKSEGHDFVGQFILDAEGQVQWVQSERILEAATSIFQGIRTLETKVESDEDVAASDVGWAAADVLPGLATLKLVRIARAAAASGKHVSLGTRTAAYSSRLARAGRVSMKTAKYLGPLAFLGTGYLVLKHPGIINDALAFLARIAGFPEWIGQLLGWTVLLLPALYILSWFMRLIVRPAMGLLHWLLTLFAWIERINNGHRKQATGLARNEASAARLT